jgi:peptide-methionine (R)-S-oxide reductase
MKPLFRLLPLSCALATFALVSAEEKTASPKPAEGTKTEENKKMETANANAKVVKSEEDWRKKLTPEQFAITRKAGTERPYGAAYEKFNAEGEGTYYCVCCGGELFTSKEKFHSGCGWPAFYDDSKANNVLERADNSHGMVRIETLCKRCDAHLGHVFEGESVSANTPTKRRFCINAAALIFVPKGGDAPKLEEVTSLKVQEKKAEVKKAAE